MSCLDQKHILTYTKWLAFLICSVGLTCKISDSCHYYLAQEIGTKTDLLANFETKLPGFAICRLPTHILTPYSTRLKASLYDKFNLTVRNLQYLKAYRVQPQDGLREIYKDFLNNDTSCIHGVSIASQSRDFLSNQNYRSTDDDFHTFFHPIYGLCIEFQPSRSTKDITGSIGVKSMKIDVNFTRAFSNFVASPNCNTKAKQVKSYPKDCFIEFENDVSDRRVFVMIYDRGSFYTSHERRSLTQNITEKFNLHQEVMDKSKIKETKENQCYEYPDEASEDQCLNNCLIQRFLKEFGCLHERLRLIDLKNETLQKMKPCLLQDLEPKYEEMVKHENQEDFSPKKKKGKKQSIEPGLFRIKEILASFLQNDLKSRCGCPIKCRKKLITLTQWPQTTSKKSRRSPDITSASFWFQPYNKIFSYHILYTGSDLIADIGGYLGLFLGLSVFGLVELLEKAIKESKPVVERAATIRSLNKIVNQS